MAAERIGDAWEAIWEEGVWAAGVWEPVEGGGEPGPEPTVLDASRRQIGAFVKRGGVGRLR